MRLLPLLRTQLSEERRAQHAAMEELQTKLAHARQGAAAGDNERLVEELATLRAERANVAEVNAGLQEELLQVQGREAALRAELAEARDVGATNMAKGAVPPGPHLGQQGGQQHQQPAVAAAGKAAVASLLSGAKRLGRKQ